MIQLCVLSLFLLLLLSWIFISNIVTVDGIMDAIILLLADRCMAVDREFAYIVFMCIQFCELLLSFECFWKSFCFPRDSGLPLPLFRMPVGPFEAPWGPKGLSLG